MKKRSISLLLAFLLLAGVCACRQAFSAASAVAWATPSPAPTATPTAEPTVEPEATPKPTDAPTPAASAETGEGELPTLETEVPATPEPTPARKQEPPTAAPSPKGTARPTAQPKKPCAHTELVYAVTEESTCQTAGKAAYTCAACGKTVEEVELPLRDHIYADGRCIWCGAQEPRARSGDLELPQVDLMGH